MKKVLVIGGTHGNEWTGVMVVKNYEEHFKKKFPTLDLTFIHGNPEAYKLNRRFKDEDLNRAFQFLGESRPASFEHSRARELKELIEKEPCFVIDLHTTTANMGKTVILTHYHPLNLKVSKFVRSRFSDCRVIGSPDPQRKYLASQSELGMMIEVGPVANGLVEPLALEHTIDLLDGILEALSAKQLDGGQLELYEEVQDVHYPKSENGEISAYIHRQFQGHDFQAIKGNYFPMKTFKGEVVTMKTEEELYPIFINEAAYYPQQLAFTLCKKKLVQTS
jgi:aspartoacylase